ncbi:MAG: hypothetical protein ACRD6W_00510, partial [Nitrososphaerales archaeon]
MVEETARAGGRAAGRGNRRSRGSREPAEITIPQEVADEIVRAVGRERGREMAARMERATRAYARDRYSEALRITHRLVELVPESVAVRELHGLACYRMGRWREAARHLEAARSSGGDSNQVPVIMDCRRALGQNRKVEAL